jgi:hypothetical protein
MLGGALAVPCALVSLSCHDCPCVLAGRAQVCCSVPEASPSRVPIRVVMRSAWVFHFVTPRRVVAVIAPRETGGADINLADDVPTFGACNTGQFRTWRATSVVRISDSVFANNAAWGDVGSGALQVLLLQCFSTVTCVRYARGCCSCSLSLTL